MNANVAFLAIPSVDNGNNPPRSSAQIASYISIATSIGSIILGLLLVRQNRTKSRENAEDVVSATHLILLNSLNEALVEQVFACAYTSHSWTRNISHHVQSPIRFTYVVVSPSSFRYIQALVHLRDRMVSFLAAFSFLCFQNSNLTTRLLVGIAWVSITVLITWCILTAWEKREESQWRSLFSSAWDRIKEAIPLEQDPDANPPKGRWRRPSIFNRRSSWNSSTTVV